MDMMDRINAYWSNRADEFSDARRRDLESSLKDVWMEIIQSYLPEKRPLKALDLGTGAGFFAFMLADLGCDVTGIDYSDAMVDNAKKNAMELHYDHVQFLQMDAQNLTFEDESFDFIFTRNVTWTLPDAGKAYAEMCRVLKPGGVLVNGDANYGAQFREDDRTGRTEKNAKDIIDSPYAHPATGREMIRERNDISNALSVTDTIRPQWDVDVLLRHGMSRISIDMEAADRVYPKPGKKEPVSDYTNAFFILSAKKPVN